jgi:hypothetical protein
MYIIPPVTTLMGNGVVGSIGGIFRLRLLAIIFPHVGVKTASKQPQKMALKWLTRILGGVDNGLNTLENLKLFTDGHNLDSGWVLRSPLSTSKTSTRTSLLLMAVHSSVCSTTLLPCWTATDATFFGAYRLNVTFARHYLTENATLLTFCCCGKNRTSNSTLARWSRKASSNAG